MRIDGAGGQAVLTLWELQRALQPTPAQREEVWTGQRAYADALGALQRTAVRGLGAALQRAAPADLDLARLLDTAVTAAEHGLGCY